MVVVRRRRGRVSLYNRRNCDTRRFLVNSNLASADSEKSWRFVECTAYRFWVVASLWHLIAEAKSRPPPTAQLPAPCSTTEENIRKHHKLSSGKLLSWLERVMPHRKSIIKRYCCVVSKQEGNVENGGNWCIEYNWERERCYVHSRYCCAAFLSNLIGHRKRDSIWGVKLV